MLYSYSVIVPVLNKQDVIERTLRSIADSMDFFDGNHPRAHGINSEVVVVDDGSTDRTPELVREFARLDPRVRIIHHHRSLRIGAARNTGVRVCSGQVLFYIVHELLRRGMPAFASEIADQAMRSGRELPMELIKEITSASTIS